MPPLLHLTAAARQQCQRILRDTGHAALKLSLRGGGCNGFEYKFETLEHPDTKLDVLRDEIDIYVCDKSLMYLIGTHIDWTRSVMGESFQFTNPNASSTCGCGSSFQPKDE
jgi:iron-sulfur cluster assembly accessory protein